MSAQFMKKRASLLEKIGRGMGHLLLKRFDPVLRCVPEQCVSLFEGAVEAEKMVDIERIALGEMEVEKAPAARGRSDDQIEVLGREEG